MADGVQVEKRRLDASENDALIGMARMGADAFGYKAELRIDRQLAQLLRLRVSQLNIADVHGDDAVREGRYPRSRNPQTETPIFVEAASNGMNGSVAMSPADVRPALAQAAASSLDEIQQALLDAALGAAREHWATFTCPDCGKKHCAQVNVPDVRSRVAAIELLLREGLGRPAQAEEPHHAALPTAPAAVKQMSWEDLKAVFAVEFASEIETVASCDAARVVRERLAGVGIDGRRILREALDDAKATAGT